MHVLHSTKFVCSLYSVCRHFIELGLVQSSKGAECVPVCWQLDVYIEAEKVKKMSMMYVCSETSLIKHGDVLILWWRGVL